MLEAVGLNCGRNGRPILRDISFCVAAGEIIAVIGTNGSGKSTLLASLAGELPPLAGSVRLRGQALTRLPSLERARQLAVLSQFSSLSFPFTGQQVVALGRLPHRSGARQDLDAVRAAMAEADVSHLASRSYLHMSGGERQRIHLARVLAQIWDAPEPCLLMDEPTSALDLAHQQAAMQAATNLVARGGAAIIATHDLNLAARYADRILVLHKGRAVGLGTPWDMLQAGRIEQVFGVRAQVQRHPTLSCPLIIM